MVAEHREAIDTPGLKSRNKNKNKRKKKKANSPIFEASPDLEREGF